MTATRMDPAEVVQAIFSVAVSVVVIAAVWLAVRSGDVRRFVSEVSQYAEAFVVLLVVLFFVLWAADQLR